MSEITYTEYTKDEALAMLKSKRHYKVAGKGGKLTNRRERVFFFHCGCPLPTSETTYLPGQTILKVPYAVATKAVEDLLRNFGERGAKIKVGYSGTCFFIGGH